MIENRKCKSTGKRISTCKNTDKHVFKAVVCVPGTTGKKRKTRVFNTRDLHEAIRLKNEFVNELDNLDYQSEKVIDNEVEVKPTLLIECMAMYIGFLNNDGVVAHKIKKRSIGHIKDVERFFKYFCLSLKLNKIDHSLLKIDHVNDRVVAILHHYILEELKYKNKTYNSFIGAMRQFINWLIEKKGYEIENPFIGITRRTEIIDKTIITKEEFEKFLSIIEPDRGVKVLSTGERKHLYRLWLKDAFQLALETGLRREEFMTLKYSDIKEGEEENVLYVQVENFKVNRLMNKEEEAKQYKSIPVTEGLKELLKDLNYKENKGKDLYLIGSEDKSSRATLLLVVSKAFSHFWKFTGSSKKANLKHLRKTYLTALVQHFGDKASMISNHSGIEVLKKHYVNSQQLVSAVTDFKVL